MAEIQKHLKSDSTCPPLKENQLRLYSMRFCPFVERAKLVLEAKNIPYEEVLINLSDQPAWYLAKNSAAEVPLLEWIDEKTKAVRSIPESLVVCDYLEDLYPEPRLHASDPFERAQQKVLISRLGNVLSEFYSFIYSDGKDAVENLNKSLVSYEDALIDQFFAGSKPGMIDYMIWPWFERFPTLKDYGFVLNADGKSPKLEAWCVAMNADPVVQAVKVPYPILKKFIESYKQGATLYDIE